MEKSAHWSVYQGHGKAACIEHKALFETAEHFLGFLAWAYKLSIPVPEIHFDPKDNFSAFATQDGQIHITAGVLDWLGNVASRNAKSLPQFFPGWHGLDSAVITHTFLYIIAHEFFHIARGHFNLITDDPDKDLVLEIDADGMGATGLLRYMELDYSARKIVISPTEMKNRVLFSLFWPIREAIGSSIATKGTTHPSWHARLACVTYKLGLVIMEDPIEGESPESARQDAIGKLVDFEMKVCRKYAEDRGITIEEDSFMRFLNGKDWDILVDPLLTKLRILTTELDKIGHLSAFKRSNLK